LTDPLVIARAVHFAATLQVAGVAVFLVFIAEPAFRAANNDTSVAATVRSRLTWIARVSLALALISGAAWFDLTAAAMSGQPVADVFSQGVWWTVLSDTTFGNDWLVRFVLACLLAGLFDPSLAERRAKSNWLKAALVIVAAAFAGSLAWAGHAAGGLGIEAIVHPAADVLHLIAAAAWVGALIPLWLLLQAAGKDGASLAIARTATLRFSTLGVTSVATILATGSINTWYLAGSIPALVDTDYGRLLLIKIALFFVMVAIAAVNRLRLTPHLVGETNASVAQRTLHQLRHNTILEAMAGAIILAIVGMLSTLPPGSHANHHPTYGGIPADATFQHIHTEQGMADVMIEPGRVGTAHATIHLWNADFGLLEAHAVTFTLTPPAAGGKPITRTAVQDADEAWQVDGIELSQPGNWMVTVDAVLGPGNRLVLEAPIVIEPKP
jgi:putative copper resistance protein D